MKWTGRQHQRLTNIASQLIRKRERSAPWGKMSLPSSATRCWRSSGPWPFRQFTASLTSTAWPTVRPKGFSIEDRTAAVLMPSPLPTSTCWRIYKDQHLSLSVYIMITQVSTYTHTLMLNYRDLNFTVQVGNANPPTPGKIIRYLGITIWKSK